MRSFEIAALGGCMLAEDTAEHRQIFGPDGQAVVYFRTPEDAAARARALLADDAERARLSRGGPAMRRCRRQYLWKPAEHHAGGREQGWSRVGVVSGPGTAAPPLRIAIAAAGRFHVLDLARELHAIGHRVRFYSYVPRSRARSFGLPAECHVSLMPFALPAIIWQRLAPGFLPRLRERIMYTALNYAAILRLYRCDVFICMSGIYLEAARFARKRYGARLWFERGSRHILAQDRILAAIDGAERPSRLAVRRELAGYEMADRIVVPSLQVEESFAAAPDLRPKLFRNPYGVDLAMFPARGSKDVTEPVALLYVGTWSLQKGCDLLEEAVNRVAGVRLTHVGAIGDLRFPNLDRRFVASRSG